MDVKPVILEGRCVRLEPMTLADVDDLARVGLYPELWRWIPTPVTNRDEMEAYVFSALEEQRRGTALPFIIVDRKTSRTIGSTRFANISLPDRRLEIGWTWITPEYQRTAANTEAKLLLLTHAFEVLGCLRVEFKTDVLNQQSRKALLRIGAIEEGVFRKHRMTASGRVRDTVYFSIIDDEWPMVKETLQSRLIAAGV